MSSLLVYGLLAVLLLWGVLMYVALRTKKVNVSSFAPYSNIIGRNLVLQSKAILAKNIKPFVLQEPYFLTAPTTLYEGVEQIAELPPGTIITFDAATHLTNGTSGVTTSNLVGELYVPTLRSTVRFEHQWGEHHVLCLEEPCGYWTFPLALWQDTADTAKYFMQ